MHKTQNLWVLLVFSVKKTLCVVPLHLNTYIRFSSHTQGSVPFQKFLVSLQSSDNHSLLIVVIPLSHWSALDTQKSLRVPTAKNPDDPGQGIVQAPTPNPLLAASLVQVMSENSEKIRRCPIIYKRNVCVFLRRGTPCKRRGKSSAKTNGTLHLSVC